MTAPSIVMKGEKGRFATSLSLGTLIKKTLSFSFNFSPFVQAQVVG